jgi:hypothetical protein
LIAIPEVVTHRYNPARGACRNLCSLPDFEASRILDDLRRTSRPTLKPNYLARRRVVEKWLAEQANRVLRRTCERRPVYFFLGDFSYYPDLSRPASLVVPLASLPQDAITFTLGDSMSVAEGPTPRLYHFQEMIELFADGEAVAGFGFSDRCGFQTRFIEVQLWESFPISAEPSHRPRMPVYTPLCSNLKLLTR